MLASSSGENTMQLGLERDDFLLIVGIDFLPLISFFLHIKYTMILSQLKRYILRTNFGGHERWRRFESGSSLRYWWPNRMSQWRSIDEPTSTHGQYAHTSLLLLISC